MKRVFFRPPETVALGKVVWFLSLVFAQFFLPVAGFPQQRPTVLASDTIWEVEEIARRGVPSTVTVVAIDRTGKAISFGSGVVIRDTRTVLTNWHVLRGASRAAVIAADGSKHTDVSFLEGDRRIDVALLSVPGLSVVPAPVAVTIPSTGARVVAIGAPLGLTQTVSDGIVSATRPYQKHLLVQITAPISPGSSGGPVFDKHGRVFAIATSGIVNGQALNFATPIRYAMALLPLVTGPRPIGLVFGAASK